MSRSASPDSTYSPERSSTLSDASPPSEEMPPAHERAYNSFMQYPTVFSAPAPAPSDRQGEGALTFVTASASRAPEILNGEESPAAKAVAIDWLQGAMDEVLLEESAPQPARETTPVRQSINAVTATTPPRPKAPKRSPKNSPAAKRRAGGGEPALTL